MNFQENSNHVSTKVSTYPDLFVVFYLRMIVYVGQMRIALFLENIFNCQLFHFSQVFNGCGKPPLLDSRRRRRRQANNAHKRANQHNNMRNTEDSRDNNERRQMKGNKNANPNRNRNNKGRKKGGKGDDYSNSYKSSPIDGFLKFIQEIGDHVLPTKYFWKRLPFHVCSDEMNVEKNRSAVCWNGHTMGK